jgi:hypothetical protein
VNLKPLKGILMRLFIDCEFNSLGGQLISMALVSEDGNKEFYEVVKMMEPVDTWVKENVMGILNKDPIDYDDFQSRLFGFLKQIPNVSIQADYPIDIMHFCKAIETGPGDWFEIQPLSMVIDDELSAEASQIPHNALEDARALRRSWLIKQDAL